MSESEPKFELSVSSLSMPEFPKLSFVQIIILSVIFGLIAIAVIIMVSLSFAYIEWDEFALKRNSASNTVQSNDGVYENGRYYWGLARTPITFKNTINTVEFTADQEDSLVIFTEGGLELSIDCSFQWKVIKEELINLYRNYALTYPQQIESIARSILKNVAPKYQLEDYYQNRDEITADMFMTLKQGLREKMNVNVTMFQLNFVILPEIVLDRLLNIAVQSQTNIKESYVQQAIIVRQQTQNLAASIKANATIIDATSKSEASYLAQFADAESFKLVQQAKRLGFQRLFTDLGLNTTELQLSFLYVTGISQSEADMKLLVDIESVLLQV